MTDKKAGRPSLSERTGEKTHQIKVLLTQSQYDYVMAQPEGASAFIRYMINGIMWARSAEQSDGLEIGYIRHRAQQVHKEAEEKMRGSDGE